LGFRVQGLGFRVVPAGVGASRRVELFLEPYQSLLLLQLPLIEETPF
jgi:hypothetical protein